MAKNAKRRSRPPRSIDKKSVGKSVATMERRRSRQRTAFPISALKKEMAPQDGFEPPTGRLTAACSTAELPGNLAKMSDKELRLRDPGSGHQSAVNKTRPAPAKER